MQETLEGMSISHAPAEQAPEWITTPDGRDLYRVDQPARRPGAPHPSAPAGDGSTRPPSGGITSPRSWAEALYAVVDLAPAIAFFVLTITLLSVGLGLVVIYIGIPILMLALIVARLGGLMQIGLARALLGAPVPPPGPFVRRRPGLIGTVRAVLGDGAGWRAIGYFAIKIVLAPFTFGLAVGLYSYGLGAISYPIWRGYLPAQQAADGSWHRGAQWWPDYFVDTVPRMAFAAALGVLVLWIAPRLVRVPLTIDRMLIAGLLGRRD
jgi:hypothetical protein